MSNTRQEEKDCLIPFLPDHLMFDKSVFSSSLLQLHFRDAAEAKKGYAWLQASHALKKETLNAPVKESCGCQKGQCFVLRLTEAQVNAVWGKDVHQSLRLILKLNRQEASTKQTAQLFETLAKLPDTGWVSQLAALLSDASSGYACTLDGIIAGPPSDFLTKYFYHLDVQTCRKAALLKDQNGRCTLRSIAQEPSVTHDMCIRFLDALDTETCRTAAILQNIYGATVATLLAQYRPSLFTLFTEKLDEKTCRALAKLEDSDQEVGLLTIIKACRTIECYRTFIAKLDEETISAVILRKNKQGYNALMAAAQYSHAILFKDIVLKTKDKIFHQGVLMDTPKGQSTLFLMASYQPSKHVFLKVLDKLDQGTCEKSLSSDILRSLVTTQAPEVLATFLKRLKHIPYSQHALLLSKENTQSILYEIACRQNDEAFVLALSFLKMDLVSDFALKEMHLFMSLLSTTVSTLSRKSLNTLLCLLDKKAWNKLEKQLSDDMLFSSSSSSRLLLRGLIDKAKEQVNKNSDLENKLHHYDQSHPFLEKNTVLDEARKSLLPDVFDTVMEYAYSGSEKAVLDCFYQGRALIKIIRNDVSKNWPDFLLQLNDYKIRDPKLRNPVNRSAFNSEYVKFVHMQNIFVEYRSQQQQAQNKKEKKYDDGTKKTSLTAISSQLHTKLFGSFGFFEDKRELVGIVVDKEKLLKIKALLSRDFHTYARGWVSNKLNRVIAYANNVECFSFTDWEAFMKRIDDLPYQVNEVLAKITRESVVGIVIGRFTKEAEKIALQRQADFAKVFGRHLPVVVYDMEYRNVKMHEAQQEPLLSEPHASASP